MTDEQKIGWLATARARVGAAYGYTLWYVTGGAAWAGVKTSSTFQATGSPVFISGPGSADFSQTKDGWAVGGGVETALAWMGAANWSAKLEYLYVDLGSVSNSYSVAQAPGSFYTISSTSNLHDHIVRAGLNYRFGGDHMAGAAPAMAGPCPTCNWTGFYIGANAGGSIGRDRAHENEPPNPPTANGANVTNPLTDVLHTESPVGGMAGGQIGFNWQTNHVVLGAEADWDWVGQRDLFANQNFVASTVVAAPAVNSLTDDQKIKSLGTARARLGWADNCFLLVRNRWRGLGASPVQLHVPINADSWRWRLWDRAICSQHQHHEGRLDSRRRRRDFAGLGRAVGPLVRQVGISLRRSRLDHQQLRHPGHGWNGRPHIHEHQQPQRQYRPCWLELSLRRLSTRHSAQPPSSAGRRRRGAAADQANRFCNAP